MIVTKESLLKHVRARYGYAIGICALVFSTGILYHYHSLVSGSTSPLNFFDNHDPLFNGTRHRKIYSLSTIDRKWFRIEWGGDYRAYNPSIIPHPTKEDTYFVTGLQVLLEEIVAKSIELVCTAKFENEVLKCVDRPTELPVVTIPGQCKGDLEYFNYRPGPRDARMFYGPNAPYLMYGSVATRNCLGLYLQDLRMLVHDYKHEVAEIGHDPAFANGTELQRPPPLADVQKNWFIFWDARNETYVHQDIFPNRSYQKLSIDGSVGPELSAQAQPNDKTCMTKYMPDTTNQMMPSVSDTHLRIHQATNSLSVTMCNRSDPDCVRSDDNTFIMTLFHYQTFWDWHAQYYPYIMLFKRTSPFQIHAISTKSLWIHGKPSYTNETDSSLRTGEWVPPGHTELFYTTSMNWMNIGNHYHGYIDDPLLLGFGIEDTRSGGMDVLAGDLLQDLGYCVEDSE
jgi:hypothetical protein